MKATNIILSFTSLIKAILFCLLLPVAFVSNAGTLFIINSGSICPGDTMALQAVDSNSTAPVHYAWIPTTGLSCSTCGNTYAYPTTTTSYQVVATDSFGVSDTAYVTVTVHSTLPDTIQQAICQGQSYAGHSAAGTYLDTFALVGGCDSVRLLYLTVNQLPVVALSDTGTGCLGGTELILTGTSFTNVIQWLLNGYPVGLSNAAITTVAGGYGTGTAANQFNGIADMLMDTSHNLYMLDYFNNRVQKWTPGATTGVTVAGGNGQGAAPNQLSRPAGLAMDASGNLYVAEEFNERVSEWAPGASSGVTVAGDNGAGNAANQFSRCWGIALDGAGNLYVADHYNHRIQKWTPGASSGVTVAGGTGQGSAANQLSLPTDVFVDAQGNLYVADGGNNRIQKFAPNSMVGVTVAGTNGVGSAADQLNGPYKIWVTPAGDIYITDVYNYRIQLWLAGATSGITVAGGFGQGSAASQFNWPADMVVDGSDIYVSDYLNSRVQKWSVNIHDTILVPDSAGIYTATVYNGACSATTNPVTVGGGLASVSITATQTTVCPSQSVTFTATTIGGGNATVYQWTKDGVNVGTNNATYTDSVWNNMDSVAVSIIGNSPCVSSSTAASNIIYITTSGTTVDTVNQTICLGQSYGGHTSAGTYVDTFTLAGGCDSIRVLYLAVMSTTPITLTATAPGCLGSTTLVVTGAALLNQISWFLNGNPIALPNTTITTVAGGNGTGTAANQFDGVADMLMDSSHNLYMLDYFNNRVQKWAPGATAGVTVAGGNGQGAAANQLSRPAGLAVDASGNLYVAEEFNERVSKWAPGANSGTTVAGGNGAGSAANQFSRCWGIAVDGAGNIFVADHYNHRIQKWAPGASSGVTVAGGTGQGNAVNQLSLPTDVFVDAQGNLYVADGGNNRIQKFAPNSTVGVTVAGNNGAGSAANQLNGPYKVWVNPAGDMYITDVYNYRIQLWMAGATSGITVAGGYGQGTAANQFNWPADMVVDGSDIYVSDYYNQRVQKWSSTGSDTIFVPDSAGTYTVTASNGFCTVTSNIINVQACAVTYDTIWPGDANSDGIANNMDILTLGLAYLDTGSVRISASNTWIGQACQPWINTTLGINNDHADCDGNGVVDANDTLPVLLNYGLTHQKTNEQRNIPGAPVLYYDIPPADSVTVNTTYSIPVDLGLAPDTVVNAYGIAFTIQYDSALVLPGSAYFAATNSWLGTLGSDLLYIQKPTVAGAIDCAVTRTNHVGHSGIGTIGTFGFITIDNLSGKKHLDDSLHLTISNIRMIDQNGQELPVNTQVSWLKVYQDVDGIANLESTFQLNLFPNPATNTIHYSVLGLTGKGSYSITDITGRELLVGDMDGKGSRSGTLDLSGLSKGIYVFKLSSVNGTVTKRIVLQ